MFRYNSDGKHNIQTNYYSDDVLTDKENERLGDAAVDNTRMINERRFMYELIGDESQKCTDNFGMHS